MPTAGQTTTRGVVFESDWTGISNFAAGVGNRAGLLGSVYSLYNYDEESLRMDIPVDYTNTLANSIDNFSFQNVGYGQFTGVLAYRPLELMYFDAPPT